MRAMPWAAIRRINLLPMFMRKMSRQIPDTGTGIRQDWNGDVPALGSYPQGINTGSTGGNETRPKNVYVNYIIKY